MCAVVRMTISHSQYTICLRAVRKYSFVVSLSFSVVAHCIENRWCSRINSSALRDKKANKMHTRLDTHPEHGLCTWFFYPASERERDSRHCFWDTIFDWFGVNNWLIFFLGWNDEALCTFVALYQVNKSQAQKVAQHLQSSNFSNAQKTEKKQLKIVFRFTFQFSKVCCANTFFSSRLGQI